MNVTTSKVIRDAKVWARHDKSLKEPKQLSMHSHLFGGSMTASAAQGLFLVFGTTSGKPSKLREGHQSATSYRQPSSNDLG